MRFILAILLFSLNASFALSLSCQDLLEQVTPGWKPKEGFGAPEIWMFDGHDGAKYYDEEFSALYSLTNEKTFLEIMERRKSLGYQNNVLDLFGSGFVVENQSLANSITGLRWGPYSRSSIDNYTQKLINVLPPTPEEILGDATNPKTWDLLRESMKKRNIPSMDLVTMRPMAGWKRADFTKTASQNSYAISLMIENVISVLSKDGRFYFNIETPFLPGDLRQHPVLIDLVRKVENETPYRLHLFVKMSIKNTTHELIGALLPK